MILVTGGTGLVGSHLLFDLIKSGEKVRALKRSTSDLSIVKKVFSCYSNDYENLFSEIEWVEGDILNIFSLKDSMEGVDKIYHSAALVSFSPEEKNNLKVS